MAAQKAALEPLTGDPAKELAAVQAAAEGAVSAFQKVKSVPAPYLKAVRKAMNSSIGKEVRARSGDNIEKKRARLEKAIAKATAQLEELAKAEAK